MIALEIPTAPPSLNRYRAMHGLAQHRLGRKLWAEVCATLVRAGHANRMRVVEMKGRRAWLRLVSPATGPRLVRIVRRYRSARYELDHDNLVGGCKPLVDALVKVGLIADDRREFVAVTYEQERGTGCRVEVAFELARPVPRAEGGRRGGTTGEGGGGLPGAVAAHPGGRGSLPGRRATRAPPARGRHPLASSELPERVDAER